MVDKPVERKTGAEAVFWDLSEYYDGADDPRIAVDLQSALDTADDLAQKYRGRVAELSAAELAEASASFDELSDHFSRLYTFASLNFNVYSNQPQWGALLQKITETSAQLSQKLIFFELEWNQIPDERAQELLDDPAIGAYRHPLEADRRQKPYQLSEAEERILIEKNVTGASAWERFFDQITGAMTAEWDGEQLPFEQVLAKIQGNADRDERRRATDAITAALHRHRMELTYIFNVRVADKASTDRLRGYPSWITSRNLSNKASDETVEALIKAVTDNYDLVARHYRIKQALLGYDELFEYDRYAPLDLKESDAFYTWDKARQIVLDAYASFSPRLGEITTRFFDENWIHAPVMAGKTGGAFAAHGSKSSHPWIFLNYTGTANDVMTLAHELGHGVHGYLTAQAQVVSSMYTPLTTAEMASVFGEMIVFKDLMAKEDDREVQLAMLAEKIDGTIATVFRQVSMNRFEDALHTARRSEGELSTERINALWMETQHDMFKGSVTMREDYGQWWSYIPHFVAVPGYVYAYAFGELLVFALYNLYEQQGADFVPQYLDLLAAGDSDYPEKLLARIGVNLDDPQFWAQGIDLIRALVDQEEDLARSLYPDKFA